MNTRKLVDYVPTTPTQGSFVSLTLFATIGETSENPHHLESVLHKQHILALVTLFLDIDVLSTMINPNQFFLRLTIAKQDKQCKQSLVTHCL